MEICVRCRVITRCCNSQQVMKHRPWTRGRVEFDTKNNTTLCGGSVLECRSFPLYMLPCNAFVKIDRLSLHDLHGSATQLRHTAWRIDFRVDEAGACNV